MTTNAVLVLSAGRLFFIKRLDKYKGRAKYGNMTHRCGFCIQILAVVMLNQVVFVLL
jgi:hypothetical protein